MSGFYLMHRGWRHNPIFKDEPYTEREAWEYLIEEAAYQDRRKRVAGVIVDVKRGQVAASTRFLAEAWGWAHSKARRFLERLEKEAMIGTASDTGITVISICNYEKYQAPDIECGTLSDTAPAQDRHSTGTNEKEGNKELTLEADASRDVASDEPIKLPKPDAISIDTLKAMAVIWREVCGDVLPVPRALGKTRQRSLRLRFVDTFSRDIDQWRKFCERVRGSPFLTGQNRDGWRADLDFMLKPKNANKLLEGGYDDRKPATQQRTAQPRPAVRSFTVDDDSGMGGLYDAVAGEMDACGAGARYRAH